MKCNNFAQLFISTHSLNFLKYLTKLTGKYISEGSKEKKYKNGYFLIERVSNNSTIKIMPDYMKKYVTEFIYLFHQVYKCANETAVNDENYSVFYNFANNARKFLEIYLYYKYPDQGMTTETLIQFFGKEKIPAILAERLNNEHSHLQGMLERGATPGDVPEILAVAKQIIARLKEDKEQYQALVNSIGEKKATLNN